MKNIKFNNNPNPFFKELKENVENYFTKNNLKKTGNGYLYTKSAILFPVFIGLYILLVFFNPGALLSILLCVILGLTIASIGFNIMHDGAHGSYSKHKWLNMLSANSLSLVGGSSFMWSIKHNIVHHSYTNVEGVDDDLDNRPFFRMAPSDRHYFFHKYQHLYWVILYMFSYISWVFIQDFRKYFTRKISEMQIKKMTFIEHLGFWSVKLFYCFIFIVLPLYIHGFVSFLVGYLIVACTTGLVISIVFQLAHVVKEAHFEDYNKETGKVEQNWAIHQIQTTVDFATKSKWVSWYTGGLNFQVEHHLFPKISHIHYPEINKIVRETCEKFNVAYLENKTLFQAIRSHVGLLKQMGTAV